MMILENTGWLLLAGALALAVAFLFRSGEYHTLRDWWKAEGMMIWLVGTGTLLIPLLAFFGYRNV
jgi:hypothetical protein